MKTPLKKSAGKMAPRFLSGFDSTSAMIMALSNFLEGNDIAGAGVLPPSRMLATEINKLSRQTQETIYALSGFGEAISPEKLTKIQSEQISRWVVNMYRKSACQAIAIGSTNGAIVHLLAALKIPWLPQSFLLPVKRPSGIRIDEPKSVMDWARNPAKVLLGNNPDLQLHHTLDPNHDRLMLEQSAFFRVKKLKLGPEYEKFIRTQLAPGATIFVIDCQRKWQTTRVDERHIFQFGAPGPITPKEYREGSDRIRQFLNSQRSAFSTWDPPLPDELSPEAEWGFEPSLNEDIERIAKEQDLKIIRIIFEEPEHPSPFVSELYRWWYRQRRIISNRLLIGSFLLIDPYWTLRTGSVPYWMKFNIESSANWLEKYLNTNDPYDEIFLMLFAHGIEPVGQAPVDRWNTILSKARKKGDFLGIDTSKIPRDFGTFIRYYLDLKNKIAARYPVSSHLGIQKFRQFIKDEGGRFRVKFIDNGEQIANPPKKSESPGRAKKTEKTLKSGNRGFNTYDRNDSKKRHKI